MELNQLNQQKPNQTPVPVFDTNLCQETVVFLKNEISHLEVEQSSIVEYMVRNINDPSYQLMEVNRYFRFINEKLESAHVSIVTLYRRQMANDLRTCRNRKKDESLLEARTESDDADGWSTVDSDSSDEEDRIDQLEVVVVSPLANGDVSDLRVCRNRKQDEFELEARAESDDADDTDHSSDEDDQLEVVVVNPLANDYVNDEDSFSDGGNLSTEDEFSDDEDVEADDDELSDDVEFTDDEDGADFSSDSSGNFSDDANLSTSSSISMRDSSGFNSFSQLSDSMYGKYAVAFLGGELPYFTIEEVPVPECLCNV